jgi:hypothetical protein
MPSAASATVARGTAEDMVPSGYPPTLVPQHEVPPWVAATAKATPVPGMPAAAKPRGEQPDAQAPQTPGDTVSAAVNGSVWVTRAARPRSANTPRADAARATIANTRSSLPSVVAGLCQPAAMPCRTEPGMPGRRPCQSVASSGEFLGASPREGKPAAGGDGRGPDTPWPDSWAGCRHGRQFGHSATTPLFSGSPEVAPHPGAPPTR